MPKVIKCAQCRLRKRMKERQGYPYPLEIAATFIRKYEQACICLLKSANAAYITNYRIVAIYLVS